MASETISNVKNKYELAKEDTFGTIPGSPTLLDFGFVQSISITEEENSEEQRAISLGHTALEIEDDVYDLSGSITTRLTHPGIANVLEALLGSRSDGASDYTISTSSVTSSDLSYYLKFNTLDGKTKQITGIHFTGGDINVTRDGSTEVTVNFYAKKLATATETLSPTTNTGKTYRGLDVSVTYGGVATTLDDMTISLDWNYDTADSRGIEDVSDGERRLIQRIIRNQLSLSGSFTSHMDDQIDTGYVDDRDSVAIVMTFSRGTSNAHTWTIATAKTSSRSRDLETGDGKKTLSSDFIGTDLTVVGDIYSEAS